MREVIGEAMHAFLELKGSQSCPTFYFLQVHALGHACIDPRMCATAVALLSRAVDKFNHGHLISASHHGHHSS